MRSAIWLVLAIVTYGAPTLAQSFSSPWCRSALAIKQSDDDVRAAYDQFAVRLHKQLSKNNKSNVITSPVSVHAAMSMAFAGAKRKTAAALAKTLALPKSSLSTGADGWFQQQARMMGFLSCPSADQTYRLDMAQAMFGQKGKVFEAPFVKRLTQAFDAKPQTVDYAADPEKARVTINDWVEDHTNNKIKNLIAPGLITKESRLTLVNALYLNAGWDQPFEPEKTRSQAFYLNPTSQIQVPMMERNGATQDYRYAKVGDADVVQLDLAGGAITMTFVVPTAVDGLAAIEAGLDVSVLTHYDKAPVDQKVNLKLPKFNATSAMQLAKVLKRLGAGLAFDPKKADFTGMDRGKDRLFVSSVVHKTFVDVHEAGLEAAAASAVMMTVGSAPPPPQEPVTVTVDRPFLFIVRSRAGGAPLIIGRIVDPRTTAG